MDYYFCTAFLFLLGIAKSQWTTDDGRNEGIRCLKQIIYEGDISNLLIDVTTPESIDNFCKRHTALQKCARDNEHYMTLEENTDYLKKTAGVHKFYVNVCPPGTDITEDYKGNAPCFKLIRNRILSCGSDLPDMNSYEMKHDLRFRCCALKNHRECLKKVTREHCGKDAATVMEKIVIRYFDRKVKECNATTYSCRESKHTTDWDGTSVPKSTAHSSKWNFPTTHGYKHKYTETEGWKSATASDWKRGTQSEPWKKHKHHNGGAATTIHSAISILVCFCTILLYKF